MSFKLKNEEHAPLGNIIRGSFVRDMSIFTERYPKFNADFLKEFDARMAKVRALTSKMTLTDDQKSNTALLYAECDELNKELGFLKVYFDDAKLNSTIIVELRNDLRNRNVEGAVLKIEALRQFIVAHQAALVGEGMKADFAAKLAVHGESMFTKNTLQVQSMQSVKVLTAENKEHYEALYDSITKIANKGKLLFKDTKFEDEYILSKLILNLRSGK